MEIRKIDSKVISHIDECRAYVKARRNVFADSTRLYRMNIYLNGVYHVIKEISRFKEHKTTWFWIFTVKGVYLIDRKVPLERLLSLIESELAKEGIKV